MEDGTKRKIELLASSANECGQTTMEKMVPEINILHNLGENFHMLLILEGFMRNLWTHLDFHFYHNSVTFLRTV